MSKVSIPVYFQSVFASLTSGAARNLIWGGGVMGN